MKYGTSTITHNTPCHCFSYSAIFTLDPAFFPLQCSYVHAHGKRLASAIIQNGMRYMVVVRKAVRFVVAS